MRIVDGGSPEPRMSECGRGADEIAALRTTCRRQAWAIETLTRVVANLRSGVSALKAENTDLRAEHSRLHDLGPRAAAALDSNRWLEARVPRDVHAAAAARQMVTRALAEHVTASVLERAKLVISELASKSVCHGALSQNDHVIARVRVADDSVWLEVEAPGCDGLVAPRAAHAPNRDGLALHIVHTLSERWGSERSAQGSTRVWAQLSTTAAPAGTDARRTPEPANPATVGLPREVHVAPQSRAATWSVYVDAVGGALSEHTSQTAAESAARAQALLRGAERIVVHDRYHRTRTEALTTPRDIAAI
jgi:anti-sigma regulatory factor (Ser/Thr protein kinase)